MNTETKRLLPDLVYHPLLLLLLCTLPYVALLGLHLHAFDLVRGELDAEGRGAHVTVFALLGGLILVSSALGGWIWRTGRRVNVPVALLLFGAGFGYLWIFMLLAEDLVPRSVGAWMLSIDELGYNHLSLVAPSLFYALVLLAGTPVAAMGKRDAVFSASVVIAIPLFWAVIAQAIFAINWDVDLPAWLLAFMMFMMTAMMLLAFLRMLLHLHRWLGGMAILPVLAGLVFPLAGLALNAAIPFPSDLQDPRVYLFTAINGLALCLPAFTPAWIVPVWFLRVALFPFTIYFFILFLPFLPLSIPAMIVMGAGFLILAPTLLFVVQAQRIVSEGMAIALARGFWRTFALLLLGLAIVPAGYLGRAWWHRHALEQAINAVYAPDFAVADPGIDTRSALAALERLRAMKEGIYTPLLSEIYDTVVFGGMVLPDHKIEEMQRRFGVDPKLEPPRSRTFEFFNFTGSRNRRANWSQVRPVPRDVVLADVAVQATTNATLVESEVVVTMTNRGERDAEYLAAIRVPEGVAVSGYWLDVEGERVEGRIFDRKTALWVFHMIRDRTRRDPGMIHYVNNDTLELRVFPFASAQTRTCAIRFLYPRGLSATVTIGSRDVPLGEGEGTGVVAAGAGLLVPPDHGMPVTVRTPYLHLLVDASAAAIDVLPTVEARIAELLERAPEVKHLRIDLVNHATRPVSATILDRANWRDAWRAALAKTKPSGGFWPQRAINHTVFTHARSDERLATVPAIVVIGAKPATWDEHALLPEHAPDITVAAIDAATPPMPAPTVVLRRGDAMAWMDHARGGWMVLPGEGDVEVYDPVAAAWTPVKIDVRLLPDSRYAQWAGLRAMEHAMASRPAGAEALRGRVLETSREHGLLSHHTAFIVVENSAQWKMLERKEKEALKANQALTFDEFQETHVTPEPAVWLMLLLLAPLAVWRWRVRSSAT
ncbi:MAG TPA: MSEP-CTERM sorting domain-containing protein [Kiritimatiellia bacterium]|nr:MSEP-CTERM sorting domain-containing protein [Kiritimatiellia bacterium]HMP33167.1 MSEP-CTERM sorting domain-containing protein [Kiritimatiellia bacterium]